MNTIYLLLGSNIGNRAEHLQQALRMIEYRCGTVVQVSTIYETAPWGFHQQDSFLNQAVHVRTGLSPTDLLNTLKTIEVELGRETNVKWGPRHIDIDILLYNDFIIDLPELAIPHLHMIERRFSLIPLCEIAPFVIHPVYSRSIGDLLNSCKDNSSVLPWHE